MKTKSILIYGSILAVVILVIFYNILTTAILLQNARTRGVLTPDIHYRFASASMDGQSLVLYHVTSDHWPDSFIHRVKITMNPGSISGQVKDIHMPHHLIALRHYGAYLPDVLDAYQPQTHFMKQWDLSVSLFELLSPHTTIDFTIKNHQLTSYQINLSIKQKSLPLLNAMASLVLDDNTYKITQGRVHILDKALLRKIQEYALSRHQSASISEVTEIKKN